MLKEQMLQEFPGLMAEFTDWERLGDADLAALSEALHAALLSQDPQGPRRAWHLERIGESHQVRRNLGNSVPFYLRALEADPVTVPTPAQRAAVLRHAPVLLTNPSEPFPLDDVVALHHPEKALIAYHLFWEDDYNFPDDLEPCDHEQLWVAYDPDTGFVTDVRTFFHSQIAGTSEAVLEANACGGRPQIRVEWGLHGSMPAGWEVVSFDRGRSVLGWLDHHYAGVIEGGRSKDHPLKRRWPARFEGSFEDYCTFTRPVDSLVPLLEKDLVFTSRWANATLQQHALTYNFAVKFDWPFDLV